MSHAPVQADDAGDDPADKGNAEVDEDAFGFLNRLFLFAITRFPKILLPYRLCDRFNTLHPVHDPANVREASSSLWIFDRAITPASLFHRFNLSKDKGLPMF